MKKALEFKENEVTYMGTTIVFKECSRCGVVFSELKEKDELAHRNRCYKCSNMIV